jgi:hypothetical protein
LHDFRGLGQTDALDDLHACVGSGAYVRVHAAMHACMARRKPGRPRRRMYARDQSPCTGRTHAKSHHARTSKVQSAGAARAELMGRSVIDARSASKRDRPSRHGRPSIARLREGEVLPGRTLVPIPHRLSGARIASRLAFASHNHTSQIHNDDPADRARGQTQER